MYRNIERSPKTQEKWENVYDEKFDWSLIYSLKNVEIHAHIGDLPDYKLVGILARFGDENYEKAIDWIKDNCDISYKAEEMLDKLYEDDVFIRANLTPNYYGKTQLRKLLTKLNIAIDSTINNENLEQNNDKDKKVIDNNNNEIEDETEDYEVVDEDDDYWLLVNLNLLIINGQYFIFYHKQVNYFIIIICQKM